MSIAKCHVLVVEDDDDIRETMADLLEQVGYDVDEARDGGRALERLRESAGGMVVLLDLNMPGMDGRHLLRIVANDEHLSTRHAFIIVTASQKTFPLDFATLLSDLRVPILTKPFDIDQLLERVRQAEQRLAQ
ncbi:MAG TPA: response regulator [Ktedonobacterales bacterium]|nr:response regulator [Ktedonobacterales bacterium]